MVELEAGKSACRFPRLLEDIVREIKNRLSQLAVTAAGAPGPPSESDGLVWTLRALPEPIRSALQGEAASEPDLARHALRTMDVDGMPFDARACSATIRFGGWRQLEFPLGDN